MKNLFLSLVFLFTVSFAFALDNVMENKIIDSYKNENVKTNIIGICMYSITTTLTFSDGQSISWDTSYTTTAGSALECSLIASAHAKRLNAKQ